MYALFDDEAPLRTSFHRWYGEFNRSHSSLQEEFYEGRSKSVVPKTIDVLQELMLQEARSIYCEIETTLGMSE